MSSYFAIKGIVEFGGNPSCLVSPAKPPSHHEPSTIADDAIDADETRPVILRLPRETRTVTATTVYKNWLADNKKHLESQATESGTASRLEDSGRRTPMQCRDTWRSCRAPPAPLRNAGMFDARRVCHLHRHVALLGV